MLELLLVLLAQVVPVVVEATPLPIPVPAAVVRGISPEMVAAIGTGVVLILTTLIGGTIKIIAALKDMKTVTAAGQEAISAQQDVGVKHGVIRDRKVQEIHLLVNSRHVAVVRLLVTMAKKEADRTGLAADLQLYQEALAELRQAEASARMVAEVQSEGGPDVEREAMDLVEAEAKAAALRAHAFKMVGKAS